MKAIIIFLSFIAFNPASYTKPTSFTPPKWEGHWEAFSANDLNLTIAVLDITKIKGKEYSWKLKIKNDFKMFPEDPACPILEYEGSATYNGVNGLISNVGGIGFTYYQETGLIRVFHDYTDTKLTEYSLCFDPGDFKKIVH